MEWHSPEQVAELLGLHVRTVRGYIRDGRLHAVRIGKQYRIAQSDLDAFTGRPPRAAPQAEVTAVVELSGIDAGLADRVSTLVVAGAQTAGGLRVQAMHDSARSHLKLIVIGAPAAAADVLLTVDAFLAGADGEETT